MKTKQIPISSTNPAVTIPIELGPNSIRGGNDERSQITAQLISDLKLSDDIVPPSEHAKKRFIYSGHKLHSMEQMGSKCLRTAMLWMPWHQIFYYLKGGHPMRNEDESIRSFFTRNFGEKLTYNLASSFVNGVYGGGIGHLSITSCSPFNQIKQIEMEYGSYFVGGIRKMLSRRTNKQNQSESESDSNSSTVDLSKFPSFTFKHGLSQLINALIDRLECDENVCFYNDFELKSMRYSAESESVELKGNGGRFEFDYVLNAVQPRSSTAFLDSNVDLTAFNLSASMVTVNVVFRNSEFAESVKEKFQGFGVLVPRELDFEGDVTEDDERSLLGLIYYSSVFPPMSFIGDSENDIEGESDCEMDSDHDEEEGVLSLVMMFGGPQFDVHRKSTSDIVSLCKSKLKLLYDIDIEQDGGTEIVCDGQDAEQTFVWREGEERGAEVLFNINRLEHAVDHYQVGHLEKKQNLRDHLDAVYQGKVAVIGSGYDGVGVPDCILSAHKSVENIAEQMTRVGGRVEAQTKKQ